MTKEERSAFFAQYWGQICKDKFGSINIWNGLFDISDYYLELKSLSNISDEDFEYLFYGTKSERFEINNSGTMTLSYNFTIESIDYLRSKSYALPFRQYSVEELVKGGVIKLI